MLRKKQWLLWLVLIVISCHKEEFSPNTEWRGTANNTLNGTSITNHVRAVYAGSSCFPKSLDFEIQKYYKYTLTDSVLRQSFSFTNISPQSGTYLLKRTIYGANYCEVNAQNAAFYTIGADGDVALDSYNVLDSEDNWLKLQVGKNGKHIRGSYQITFVIEHRSPVYSANMPDTLQITNGSFIIERQ